MDEPADEPKSYVVAHERAPRRGNDRRPPRVPDRGGHDGRAKGRGDRRRARVAPGVRRAQRDERSAAGAARRAGGAPMIRVAAVGDVHFGTDSAGMLSPHLEQLPERADLLLVAGDLTTCGGPDEAEVLADELRDSPVPVLAVLGNHDYHAGHEGEVRTALESAGVQVLEGETAVMEVDGSRVGVAGVKGF